MAVNEDVVSRGVEAMVRLEPALRGKESQIAVILVTALIEKAKEDGRPIATTR